MVQNYTRDLIVTELKQKLDTDLGIGRLYFRPFNTLGLDSLYIHDRDDNKIFLADNVSATIDLYELLKQNIVISSTRLSDFDVYLSKQSKDSTLNIQFIIDAFKSKEEKPKSQLQLQINAINIDNGNFHYDVLDRQKRKGKFDANHISISDLHAKLALKSLQNDSLNIQIRKLGLKEKSGFEITNLVGRLVTKDEKVSLKGFELILPDSKIEFAKLDIELPKDSVDKSQPHSHSQDVKLDFVLSQSYISPADIAAFVPELEHFDDRVSIKADISGYEHNLNMSNLTLNFGERLRLVANAEIRDWFEDGDTYILAAVDELTISGTDIKKLADSFSKKEVLLPREILDLKNISFQGDISGYLNQLTAFGTLDTDKGIIRTDVLLGFNKKEKAFSFAKGKIYTTGFQLGELLQNKDLGNTSFSISIDMEKPLYKEIKGTVKGLVHEIDFKGYTYNDISLDVKYLTKRIDGVLSINDSNGEVNLEGMLDFSNKEYPILNVDGKVRNVQLGKLNLVSDMENSFLSLDINANFVGSNIDNVQGLVEIDSLEFYRDQKLFELDKLSIEASGFSSDRNRRIEIKSDILTGEVVGQTSFASLVNSIKYTLNDYLPALIRNEVKPRFMNNFNFRFNIENTEILSDILKLPVIIYEPASISGFYKNDEEVFKVEVKTPSIKAGGMSILSGYVLLNNTEEKISAKIKALVEGKNQLVNDISIDAFAQSDNVTTSISLQNNAKSKVEGHFNILTEFDYLGQRDGLRTRINIDESDLLLNNSQWHLKESSITLENKMIDVNNFWFYTEDGKQELRIHGKYSQYDPSHILKTQLRDIDLTYVFEVLAIDALRFGGYASGNVFLSSIEGKPYANTRLEVAEFKFNNAELGKLNLFSELDDETNEVILDGLVTSKENKKTKVDGVLDPVNQKLSIHFDADSIDISFLHHYAQSIFDKVDGRASGKVHLHGDFSNVTVEGSAKVLEGTVGIKFLNADYKFSDEIHLRDGLIYFNDIEFKDKLGNVAYGSGKVVHNYFQDIVYHIEFSAKNFLVYNATEEHNPIFYGQVFGSGKGMLSGDEQEINIDINMQTQANSFVRMNFMEDVVNEYSFMTYKEPEKEEEETVLKSKSLAPIKTDSGMNINMNFYIDATPDATFELLMDPTGGDVLRGAGSGAMQFEWSSKLEPKLFGTFNVNRGSYNFTFQRIMERKFSIQDGSTIQFRGDPFQATLDVNAIYKLTASLSDLDRSLVEQSGQMSIPVHCVLNLSGQLQHPSVGLDIKFPTANADVERQIKSYMDTEDMINRQVAFLLLLSKFHTPDAGRVDHPTSDFAAVASATLSSQLSKIVSQVDERWQLGTHIRMSDAEMTSTEVELLLSSQLLNDRLLINGNFGYRDDPYINSNAVITDVDIEFLLNNSGTWRIKAYNHYNEKFYYLQDTKGIQTQGVGIMYRKDFDKISDLLPFRKKIGKPLQRDTIHQVVPDSIQKGSALSHFVKMIKK